MKVSVYLESLEDDIAKVAFKLAVRSRACSRPSELSRPQEECLLRRTELTFALCIQALFQLERISCSTEERLRAREAIIDCLTKRLDGKIREYFRVACDCYEDTLYEFVRLICKFHTSPVAVDAELEEAKPEIRVAFLMYTSRLPIVEAI